jgi:predicted nucleotidyltransferase
MTRDEALKTLREHAPELRSSGLSALYLFGSMARGEATDDSDIDLLFEVGAMPDFSLLHQAILQERLEKLLGRHVDLISRNALRARMKQRVEADLVPVF